jgi:hypothetical protein
MLYIFPATVQYAQTSSPNRWTIFFIFIIHKRMFWPYILAVARELQVWSTCRAYLPIISCNWLVVRCMCITVANQCNTCLTVNCPGPMKHAFWRHMGKVSVMLYSPSRNLHFSAQSYPNSESNRMQNNQESLSIRPVQTCPAMEHQQSDAAKI